MLIAALNVASVVFLAVAGWLLFRTLRDQRELREKIRKFGPRPEIDLLAMLAAKLQEQGSASNAVSETGSLQTQGMAPDNAMVGPSHLKVVK